MDAEIIRREALSLPPQARAELAEQLLSSLEPLSEEEIERLWFAEAARRADEIDRGAAKRYSADEVQQQAKSLLR
jgi:putative addiction module component (TIGR02574 family)